MSHPVIALLLLCIIISAFAFAQGSSKQGKAITFPPKLFSTLDKKTRKYESDLTKKTDQCLTRLERHEKKLYKKLYRMDSLLVKQTFGDVDSTYAVLKKHGTGSQIFKRSFWSYRHDDNCTKVLTRKTINCHSKTARITSE
jgi:hypothetical protein